MSHGCNRKWHYRSVSKESFRKSKKSTIVNYLKDVHGKFDGFHNIIHIGGDEVPHDGATVIWESSPICQNFIKEVCFQILQFRIAYPL